MTDSDYQYRKPPPPFRPILAAAAAAPGDVRTGQYEAEAPAFTLTQPVSYPAIPRTFVPPEAYGDLFDPPPKQSLLTSDGDDGFVLQPLLLAPAAAANSGMLIVRPPQQPLPPSFDAYSLRRGTLILGNIGERINHAYPVAATGLAINVLTLLAFAIALVRLYMIDL